MKETNTADATEPAEVAQAKATKPKEIKRRGLDELQYAAWLKLEEAARYVGLSQITLRRHIEKKELKASKKFRHLMFARSELDRWMTEGQSK
jgi:excisionase family DNA binding protein